MEIRSAKCRGSILLVVLIAGALAAIAVAGVCPRMAQQSQPNTTELGVRTLRDGKPVVCLARATSATTGRVVEGWTDNFGVIFFKAIEPGSYALSFADKAGKFYPATATIAVERDGSTYLQVDLDAPDGQSSE